MTLTDQDKSYIKGYAQALQDIMFSVTGENTCGKSYDPCDIDDEFIHSYAFDMKDCGRHHPLSDYSSIKEIEYYMLSEGSRWIKMNAFGRG